MEPKRTFHRPATQRVRHGLHIGRRVASWRISALVVALLVSVGLLASYAIANTGPNTVSISSVGGYNLCLNNILAGDVFHYFRSVQGTEHPYRAAAYRADDSLGGLSGQVSNDGWYAWNEFVDPVGDIRRMRIDNQAAASGNGLYTCQSVAA